MRTIAAQTLREWILDGAELAILDAREEGEFGRSHLFWAVPLPLSRREARARALLPRLGTRIVCVDGGEGYAATLSEYLTGVGCTDLSVLDGGTPGWAAAGYELFSGVNVPSKAFGEWVEHRYGTESIDPETLAAWRETGKDMVVLDSRPLDEFVRMSIPGAVNVPGGELAYRARDLAPDPATTIVVNCAGRTRSIMGAESLRRAGVANPVVALRNGTMGWELAGFAADRGRTERYAPGIPHSAEQARAGARAFAEASGVGVLGVLDLTRFEEDGERTCTVLDVRDPDEFRAGHRPGSKNAPGGQLVQATDRWIAVRGARVVLLDDDGVRARMAASWLRQMGHADVFVAEGALDEVLMTPGVGAPPSPQAPPKVGGGEAAAPLPSRKVLGEGVLRGMPVISPNALAETLRSANPPRVIDIGRSLDFRQAHIPGAVWAVRGRLPATHGERVVLTSPDGTLATLAVAEAYGTAALEGGTAAWRAAGFPLEASAGVPADGECVDVYLRPYDRTENVEAAMREYLSWEIELVRQIERDGTVRFGVDLSA